MSAVFNLANTQASIGASGPCVRILGLNLSGSDVNERSTGQSIETRVWPMSTPETTHWKPITNVNVSAMNDTELQTHLETENASVADRLKNWTTWRDGISEQVNNAARNHIMRPVHQIRAHYLLSLTGATKLAAAEPVAATVVEEPAATVVAEPAAVVPTLSRNDEIRGQTWALIGICGDANYENSKNELLQALGSAYFEYILSIMPPAEPTDAPEAKPEVPQCVDTPKEQLAERLFMESGQSGLDTMIEVLGRVIEKTRQSLLSLSKEPMIAFFDVSEDPETLETASASIIAKNSSFKHVDLAVVRLYSWIKLDYSPKRPKSHTSRDPKANSFYQSMTSTTSTTTSA